MNMARRVITTVIPRLDVWVINLLTPGGSAVLNETDSGVIRIMGSALVEPSTLILTSFATGVNNFWFGLVDFMPDDSLGTDSDDDSEDNHNDVDGFARRAVIDVCRSNVDVGELGGQGDDSRYEECKEAHAAGCKYGCGVMRREDTVSRDDGYQETSVVDHFDQGGVRDTLLLYAIASFCAHVFEDAVDYIN